MRATAGRVTPRNLGRAAVVAAFAALMTVPAGAAWDGTQKIRLGDSIGAEFGAAVGTESHVFSFYAPETTKISSLVKPLVKTSGLAAAVGLVDGGGADVALGAAGTGTAIKNFVIANRGNYGFKVTSTAGTGEYRLTTKATWPKLFSAQLTTTLTYEFGAPAGSTVDIAVKKAKTGAAAPTVSAVSGPKGAVAITAGALVRKLALTADGKYRVTVTNAGTAGDPIDLAIKFTAPKGGRPWLFGTMEAPVGTDDNKRALWLGSAHAAIATEAFAHWNNDLPAVIPTSCAKCHSGTGYRDFLGVDGTAAGTIEVAPAVGRVVDCETCHNAGTANLTQVTFAATGNLAPTAPLAPVTPTTITGIGDESRCMICHQGRESKYTLDSMISLAFVDGTTTPKTLLPVDVDATDSSTSDGDGSIGFKNIHYFAAAATLYGRDASVGYEYDGKAYEKKFTHVEDYNTCIECHDPHTLKVKISDCATCHEIAPANVTDPAKYEDAIHDLHQVRMAGTVSDFDGDGTLEGTYEELVGTSDVLLKAIKEYAKDVNAAPIGYDGAVYPYFFADANENGTIDTGEGGYAKWTARLVKAAFNYQMFKKDPGGFAHNGKYLNELMYDSITDLDAHALVDVTVANGYPVNLASLVRNDIGHFDTSADAFTDWADDTGVSSSCARCHSLEGFRFRVKYGIDTTISQPTVAGMLCESCHVVGADFKTDPARVYVDKVAFMTYPTTATSTQIAGVTINNNPTTPDDSFVCMTCHQGRQSKISIDIYTAAQAALTPTPNTQKLQFQHVHYFPAGATQYSTKAGVAYPWTSITDSTAAAFPAARKYAAPWTHYNTNAWVNYSSTVPNSGMPAEAQCTFCHMQDGSHKFEPETGTSCKLCHGNGTIETYRASAGGLTSLSIDFDGDAATTELVQEVQVFKDALYANIKAYAARKAKPGILFSEHEYGSPYWFKDADLNGLPDPAVAPATGYIRYADMDKYMVYASHDLTMAYRDAGSWAHNPRYTLQYLYDAIDYMDDELWNGSPVNPVNGAPLVRPITN